MSDDLNRPADNEDNLTPQRAEEHNRDEFPCEPVHGLLPAWLKIAGVLGALGFVVYADSAFQNPARGSTRSARLEWQQRRQQAAEALQRDQQFQKEATRPADGDQQTPPSEK